MSVYVFQGSQTWFHQSMLLNIFFRLKLNVQVSRTFLRSTANQIDVYFNQQQYENVHKNGNLNAEMIDYSKCRQAITKSVVT